MAINVPGGHRKGVTGDVQKTVQVLLIAWFVIASAIVFIPAMRLLFGGSVADADLFARYQVIAKNILGDWLTKLLTAFITFAFVTEGARILGKYVDARRTAREPSS